MKANNTFSYQAARNPEEEGDYMAFEQLMTEAMSKKGKDEKKRKHKAHLDHHETAESS